MPKIDLSEVTVRKGTGYPPPYDKICEGREKQSLGDAAGLTQFGVQLVRLKPGAAAAQRHWHENEDEFVYVVSGQVTLVEDDAETPLDKGDAAGFKAGVALGHTLINRSKKDCVMLIVGTRADQDRCHYTDPEVDLEAIKEPGLGWRFTGKDDSPRS